MQFQPTAIEGVVVVVGPRHEDERGSFGRLVDEEAFAAAGLPTRFVQVSQSRNRARGTLRGMHLQAAPHEEDKLVTCTHGAAFDVVVDLRPASASYGRWLGFELSAESGRAVFIPRGCAHGFLTTVDDTDLVYFMTTPHVAAAARGVRFDDVAFGITWPAAPTIVSARDRAWPDFDRSRGPA
ncbi:MAG: dTDP-4-dehydrorhamnose 3,5-epimerase family protein [Deltaproteobacteria bacterium]|nr:dTDP-4-dehydrorhamnose 3,5-epimerase family protein [Deltaproteobacteria bacterium]